MSSTDNIPPKYHKDDSKDLKSSYLDDVESTNKGSEEVAYQAKSEEISNINVDIETEKYSISKPKRITIRAKIIP